MANFNILESLNSQIQRNDEELLILLKRRFQSEKKVIDYLLKNPEEEINFEEREVEHFEAISQRAREMGLKHLFIQDVFDAILNESKIVRDEHLKEKQEKQRR